MDYFHRRLKNIVSIRNCLYFHTISDQDGLELYHNRRGVFELVFSYYAQML